MNLNRSLLAILIFVLPLSGWSATVTNTKGQRVLINLDGADSAPGDEYYLLDPATNKKRAIIRITQVKGGKAIGQIVKGKGAIGYTLQAKASSAPMSADVSTPGSDSGFSSRPAPSGEYLKIVKDSWGVLGEYLMASMDATQKLSGGMTNSSSMKGSGFGAGAFYDYAYTSNMIGRGIVALEQFSVSGSAGNALGCSGGGCNADFTYLSLYGVGKYHFMEGKYRPWAGGGVGFLIALSKSSSILNAAQVSTNQTLLVAGGVDIQLSRKNYVPVSLEYTIFPPSDTVKANMIVLKAGWAWNL
ncbi:hypothetical protein D3C87_163140 [compost metagenome]